MKWIAVILVLVAITVFAVFDRASPPLREDPLAAALTRDNERSREQIEDLRLQLEHLLTKDAEPGEPSVETQQALTWLHRVAPKRYGRMRTGDLEHVWELDLSRIPLKPADLEQLNAFPGLRVLNLRGTGVTDEAIAHLAALTSLESINLVGALVTDDGLAHLTALPSLAEIDLGSTEISDAGVERLRAVMTLERVGLGGTKITDTALIYLKGLPLRGLDIGRTTVTDEGLAHLDAFQLEDLSVYRNTTISDEGLRHIGKQAALKTLMLRGTDITEKGLAHLEGLTSLQELNASMVVGDAGMVHIGKLTALRTLGLYSNPTITDVGMVHLQALTSLERLQLQFTTMTDRSLAYLDKLPLNFLDVRGTGVTQEGADAYKASHPTCRVLR